MTLPKKRDENWLKLKLTNWAILIIGHGGGYSSYSAPIVRVSSGYGGGYGGHGIGGYGGLSGGLSGGHGGYGFWRRQY